MVAFAPTAIDAFLSNDDGSAVVMLNLLQFAPDGGRERHAEYLDMAKPILAHFGAEVLFRADGLPVLTTGGAKDWDAVLLVRYPNRSVFHAMTQDPEYQKAFEVGRSALVDIVLQPLRQTV